VELADGERLALLSLSGEPGYGFLTLSVEAEQLIVPVGSIRRITLGPADEDRKPGFALPERKGRNPPHRFRPGNVRPRRSTAVLWGLLCRSTELLRTLGASLRLIG
jgi:hypothetical protein